MPETTPTPSPRPRAVRRRVLDRCPSCGAENVNAAPCPARCGKCDACCRCGDREPSDMKQWSTRAEAFFHPGDADSFHPRYTSVEIEFNGTTRYGAYVTSLMKRLHGYVLNDASAGGNGTAGWEINTPPARGQTFRDLLKPVTDMLAGARAKVDRGCGLHCHVNVGGIEGITQRPFTGEGMTDWRGVLRIALLWARVERAIFGMVADSRDGNEYCQPHGTLFVDLVVKRANAEHDADLRRGDVVGACLAANAFTEDDAQWVIEQGLYGSQDAARAFRYNKNPRGNSHWSQGYCRRASLNLHTVFFHGTVEFRVHHATLDYDKIIHWAGLCGGLVQYALTHTAEEIGLLRGTPAEIIDRAVNNAQVTAWRKTRFAFFYEKRSAERNGGQASSGARMGARRRSTEPRPEVAAPPVNPEASE